MSLHRLDGEDLAPGHRIACIEGGQACGPVTRSCSCSAYVCKAHGRRHTAACEGVPGHPAGVLAGGPEDAAGGVAGLKPPAPEQQGVML